MRRHPHFAFSCTLIGLLAAGTPLCAAPREDIPLGYRQVASEYGLPPALLYATALTASGRGLGAQGFKPWPWTLTLEGQRRHYPTRVAGYQALTAYLAGGGREVRVGVMGLRWRRYGAHFGSPWAALDPYTNLRFAAARFASQWQAGQHGRPKGAALAARKTTPMRIAAIQRSVHTLAPRYHLDPGLVLAVIEAESAFDPQARSPKGAQGLMQLMPSTAKRFGIEDPFDANANLEGGLRYLHWLTQYYGGDLARVLAAYNAGEGTVDRYGGIPPYPETRAYLVRVLRRYGERKT